MRNASDIFFLKEDNGDSNNIFSVNGSCPMKIRRRRQIPQNDCFEYGRSKSDLLEVLPKGLHDDAEANEIDEECCAFLSNERNEKTEGDSANEIEKQEEEFETKKKERNVQSFSSSSMKRNILTGAGMEIVEHRKPKKGPSRREKGLW